MYCLIKFQSGLLSMANQNTFYFQLKGKDLVF